MSGRRNSFPLLVWLRAFFRKGSIYEGSKAPERTESANKYFTMMLGEFFSRLGEKDGGVDANNDLGAPAELDENPMLNMLDKKRKNAETQDMHESADGNRRNVWNEAEGGEALSGFEQGGASTDGSDYDDLVRRLGDRKLGEQSQQSRISTKLNSVVSEAMLPEQVVFNEIGEATRIFNWRRILRQNGAFDVDWSYKNALVEDGIVRPSLEATPVAVTEIVLDTSGSVDEPLLKRFLQECRNILPYSQVKIGCFDTQFYGFKDIKSLNDLESMVFEGRHGTSFSAALGAFSGRADNRIIFTDGDAPMPAQRMDVIWIVFGGKRIRPNGGRVFYVYDDLYKRMKA